MTASPAYTRIQIILHWLVVVLVLFNYVSGDFMEEAYDAALNAGTVGGPTPHAIAGLTILVLIIVRMVIKARRGGAPAPVPGTTAMMHRLSNIGHLSLYALAIVVPVTGMLTWGARIEAMADVHEMLTKLLMVVAIGHAVMALWHHFVKKDATLSRMLRPQ